tara:strand:- start:7870 stop:8436 length:567 start_codon:yes stop_codon:yes gene_type:complete
VDKESAKKQFDEMTEELGIEHTFSFDTAWSFAEYVETQGNLSKPIHFKPSEISKKGFQDGIIEVEKHLKANKKTFSELEKNHFNPIKHKFCNGLYIREIFNPAGQLLVTKIHKKDNAYFLMKGVMTIVSEEGETTIKAPYYGVTKAGTKRIIYIHEDCIFITVHPTNAKNVEDAEKELIAKNFKDIEV